MNKDIFMGIVGAVSPLLYAMVRMKIRGGIRKVAAMSKEVSLDKLLDDLVEKKYQLRLEHNHSDMKWYAYYAGKAQRQLFDEDVDWETGSDTPLEAVTKLTELVASGRVPSNASLIRNNQPKVKANKMKPSLSLMKL
jgi:hypothetical protein